MIEAVHHFQVSIPIGAEQTARDFYCDLLGLKEIPKPPPLAGRGGFWLEHGSFQIHFGTEDGIDRVKTRSHLAYLVTDLELLRDRLSDAGYPIKDSIPLPGLDRFESRDPFGNRIEFLQAI